MAIRVALNHTTEYHYDRLVNIGPQVIRLRPAPHTRTPIESYSLKVEPEDNYLNWQQDPFGNFQARYIFKKPAKKLTVAVELVAEMTVINPFDFYIEPEAEAFPFKYAPTLRRELQPYFKRLPVRENFQAFLDTLPRQADRTIDYLVEINMRVQKAVGYTIRMEPGVQSPEKTLTLKTGSCRDSAWLLVQTLRRMGLAARFVSGYLIQLKPDQKSLDGPSGSEVDFTDLHAWTEVFIPGAGWIGMDPTSGLLTGEGHIPLAATPAPQSAAPISGGVDRCKVDFKFDMSLTRIEEQPRVTLPYRDDQWDKIQQLGELVDMQLNADDVRLTMGGEPTFVSIDDMEGEEWNSAAVGEDKQRMSNELIKRFYDRFAKGGFIHYGQGKWYPGEQLPRWSMGCYWRLDGKPVWQNPDLLADTSRDYGLTEKDAERFTHALGEQIGVDTSFITPAYEDSVYYMWKERRLPVNVDPADNKLSDPLERERLSKVFERGLDRPKGYVMPLERQWWQGRHVWASGPWPVKAEEMFLLPGDSPLGLRLPLDSLSYLPKDQWPTAVKPDPVLNEPLPPLPDPEALAKQTALGIGPVGVAAQAAQGVNEQGGVALLEDASRKRRRKNEPPVIPSAKHPFYEGFGVGVAEQQAPFVVRTALCVEPRDGRLYVFMPPVPAIEEYLELIAQVEQTAEKLNMPVVIEGYAPPHDPRVNNLKVTPDPGVIEVNVHPAGSWNELKAINEGVYEDAHKTRLGTEKFDLDGKHWGTGGGNHIVMGGATPADSPFLRRPDVLKSMLAYWHNHPSLSYMFSGRFVGPTSQAPRFDEGRQDAIYEMGLAMAQVPSPGQGFDPATHATQVRPESPAWLTDRIFRNLLVDLTGNTHRAEFCIDKLYSPDSSTGRLGLVELRGFEMPPHVRMSLTQQLLIRSLVAKFWRKPYEAKLVPWGTSLYDRFFLPNFVWQDFADVLDDVRGDGFDFDSVWFQPHFEFRFPLVGRLEHQAVDLEIRTAIEPWNVLGEEPGAGGTSRSVDSSLERVEVRTRGLTEGRHVICCNGRKLPLHATGVQGEYVAGVRYRAWQPPHCLHPTIPVHAPLVFDIVDTWHGRAIAGCQYNVSNPSGRNPDTFPINSLEAESRRNARFQTHGHTPTSGKSTPANPGTHGSTVSSNNQTFSFTSRDGRYDVRPEHLNPAYPMTLDLRRPAEFI